MQDLETSIAEFPETQTADEWRAALEELTEEHGAFQPLGEDHCAALLDAGRTLLVTFEDAADLRARAEGGQPLGFSFAARLGWSHLGVYSEGLSWFREPRIYGYFDRLIDDGFFEDFDRVLFFGAGACGYAAAAFSVAAPGATVLAIQPQATQDPRMTEWDPRFPQARRFDFSDRFGYAPDMIDAADKGFVLYDPREDLDAMHATLFARPNVTRLRMPLMGEDLIGRLCDLSLLGPLIESAADDTLSAQTFARFFRARREDIFYLRALSARLVAENRPYLEALLSRHVLDHMHAPHFRRRLKALEKDAALGRFRMPPDRVAGT